MNQPRSSIVDEQVYPLKFGTQVVDVEELAQVRQAWLTAMSGLIY
jgi:hypothetical protein